MKFLATIILLTFLAATVIAGDCMKAPFHCNGMSFTCTTAILVTLFTTTASATECTVPVLCTRSVGKSRLIANIPGFEEFGDSYSSIECAQSLVVSSVMGMKTCPAVPSVSHPFPQVVTISSTPYPPTTRPPISARTTRTHPYGSSELRAYQAPAMVSFSAVLILSYPLHPPPSRSPSSSTLAILSSARQNLTRLPNSFEQGKELVGSVSVARVRPRTSKGITDLLLPQTSINLS
ncbi:hypothetical protein CC77DRAFT_1012418 [Alternaria alternata]|uniref:Uncharacterized protein n=1 Tax=Alternaria alternata TaxID=5599 RepID=A0A177D904_ALTAL|nr:hypothetical protein CC77DRAFT_1012418 [Alternaria alternata]OAG16243.1 hypothetical protein CC77DRAFT_1012418 [Alternaria alternata]